MGTRNLTMVVKDGEFRVAQYGQWDGYPEGQGLTVLGFLRNMVKEEFEKKLSLVRFNTEKDEKDVSDFLESIGSKNGWLTSPQSEKYQQKFPLLTRDNGAEILNLINGLEEDAFIYDSTSLMDVSSWVEWAYLIDLDRELLEVYTCWNVKRPIITSRWDNVDGVSEPISMVWASNIDSAVGMSDDEFIDEIMSKLEPEE